MAEPLEEEIIFGRPGPRERLVEDALTARFGVKRQLVRDAPADLEKLGLVERAQPQRLGAGLLAGEMRHIFEMREPLHGHAAATVPLPGDPELVQALQALEALHTRQSAAVECGDPAHGVPPEQPVPRQALPRLRQPLFGLASEDVVEIRRTTAV